MNISTRTSWRRSRTGGFSIVEIVVSVAMLSALLTLLGKAIVAVNAHLQQIDQRVHAMRTVENLLERVLLSSWDAITEERIRTLPLPEELLARWPEAELDGSVTAVNEPVAGKRITLRFSPSRGVERPVSLTTWVFRAPQE